MSGKKDVRFGQGVADSDAPNASRSMPKSRAPSRSASKYSMRATFSAHKPSDIPYKASNAPPPSAVTDVGALKKHHRQPRIPLKRGMTSSRVKQYPLDPPPESLILPYVPTIKKKEFSRTIHVDSHPEKGPGNQMGALKVKQERPTVPGWLQDLDEEQLRGMMGIKDALTLDRNDPVALIQELSTIINDELGVPMPTKAICKVLNEVKRGRDGSYNFSEFLYYCGNPAKIKARKNVYVSEKTKIDCAETLTQCKESGDKEVAGGGGASSEASEKDARDQYGYMPGERLFWSALLIFEMYETLQGVEKLYFNDWIPPPSEREQAIQLSRGFGPNDHGYKKIGTSEWDRPPAPIPKLSPYLHPVPFVTTRWNIKKPNQDEKGRRRTLWQMQPVHLVIHPPRTSPNPIKITENRRRIRAALEHLAEAGNCVALLPDIAFVIHLSDTFIDKLEAITVRVTQSMIQKTVYHNNDIAWISREIKDIYRPHGLPHNIIKLRHMIRFTDGLELRKICNHIRHNQWGFISNRKLEFREEAWRRMHIERIPEGRLRESFIYSFVTYSPYISHLPIVHDQNQNPT